MGLFDTKNTGAFAAFLKFLSSTQSDKRSKSSGYRQRSKYGSVARDKRAAKKRRNIIARAPH